MANHAGFLGLPHALTKSLDDSAPLEGGMQVLPSRFHA